MIFCIVCILIFSVVCVGVFFFGIDVFVFFFKQKTAYEMRISDWSSDVCSSDLSRAQVRRSCRSCRAESQERCGAGRGNRLGHPCLSASSQSHQRRDRKSVVSGKSVSVRVDLGGRRNIKKKIYSTNKDSSINTAKMTSVGTTHKIKNQL